MRKPLTSLNTVIAKINSKHSTIYTSYTPNSSYPITLQRYVAYRVPAQQWLIVSPNTSNNKGCNNLLSLFVRKNHYQSEYFKVESWMFSVVDKKSHFLRSFQY